MFITNIAIRACETAELVKVFATKCDNMNLNPSTHRVDRENCDNYLLTSTHLHTETKQFRNCFGGLKRRLRYKLLSTKAQSSVSSINVRWLTTTHNSSFRESEALGLQIHLHIHIHTCTHILQENKLIYMRWLDGFLTACPCGL